MKRTVYLLLAMILAMTMVMGIGVTAFAAVLPEEVNCGVEHDVICSHIYISSTDVHYSEHYSDDCVYARSFDPSESYVDNYECPLSWFEGRQLSGLGWYYWDSYGHMIKCNQEDPIDPVDPATPTPTPKKESKKEKEQKEGISYLEYLAMLAANESDKDVAVEKELRAANAAVDKDTFKSEAPAKTIMSTDTMGADKFLDLKVHAADERTKLNQQFLCNALVRPNAQILLTENVYSGRDLSIAENGSLQTLTWNNLPKNQPGPVYAVVYNQKDGAYVLDGILDAKCTATFTGFKLRPASTITICK